MIEIDHVLPQDPAKVPLIEHKHMVGTLGPGRFHPPLSDRVGPGSSERGANLLDSEPL